MSDHDHMTPEDKLRVAAQVDYFIEVAMHRYGLEQKDLPDILESLRWLRGQRDFVEKIKTGGTLSMIGLLIAALGSVVLQGLRSMVGLK